jgi:hypothetical protein
MVSFSASVVQVNDHINIPDAVLRSDPDDGELLPKTVMLKPVMYELRWLTRMLLAEESATD